MCFKNEGIFCNLLHLTFQPRPGCLLPFPKYYIGILFLCVSAPAQKQDITPPLTCMKPHIGHGKL